MNDIVALKQPAIIQERLKSISDEIDEKVNYTESLVCTLDNVKEIKKIRAEIKKQFEDIEQQRKLLKTQVMKPYTEFEKMYKEYISEKYKKADLALKSKINDVESVLIDEKKEECQAFFSEYCENKHIDFLTLEQAPININLSVTAKKLKESIAEFVNKVENDLKLIDTQENQNEILIEYKKSLDVNQSIIEVKKRHDELKAIEEQKEGKAQIAEREEETTKKVAEFAPPEEVLTVKFTVHGTKTQLKALKAFMQENNLDFE